MYLTKATHLLLIMGSFLLASCLPEQNAVRDLSATDSNSIGNTDGNTDDGSELPNDDITSGISSKNFFQEGATTTFTALNLYSNFSDSFLMRGDNIHNYVKNRIVGTQKKLCLAFHYPLSVDKKILVLAARVRSFYNSGLQGTEYYLQAEPANENANVNDCLNPNVTTSLGAEYGTNLIAFEIADVCPNCASSVTSESADMLINTGAKADTVAMNALGLNILPEQGSGSVGGLTCSSDAACKVEGFNCCLQNQCVNHGETRPGTDTNSSQYQSALEQILDRPELITNYSEYFYICPNMVPTDPNDPGDGDTTDPEQDAADLVEDLEDVYMCLNPILDEYAVCARETPILMDNIGQGGTTLAAGSDDLTFHNLNPALAGNNIYSVEYAGMDIYKRALKNGDTEIPQDSDTVFTASNDDLDSAQSVTVDKAIPTGAKKSNLKIRYLIDGTCERLGSGLARCSKEYVQGQDSSPWPRPSDHPAGNNNFQLPYYANFDYNIIVEVGGVQVPKGSDTWTEDDLSKTVRFSNPVYNNQKLKFTYFVTDDPDRGIEVDKLMAAKEAAQTKVNEYCKCDPELGCNLKPVYETVMGEEKLVNYECSYNQPDTPEAPLQETVYISSKTVPHRYFDRDGVHYEANEIGDAQPQEGLEFSYASDNSLRPNNQNQYVGFNEIYGSFSKEEISPMPATVVDIEKGVQYDIFVDSGSFSSCLSCGTDYFSNLQKLFPGNFLHMGGGYLPDMVESRRRQNQGDFSGDDMKFGRACFVPATMIPWTHKESPLVTKQRRDRLAAQHFLFANGYNKDWYGFDYGSLIGSYDGVKWFSIGNQRRIQAKSNKLYIAINAYYGDLTIDNTFKVTVSELSSIINSGSAITHDTDSDGAQCQLAHYCDTDNDCIAQLGYEYSCQSVSGVTTPWPLFDGNGNEISGSTEVSLLSLVGGSNGQVKRCVYRGAGSLCEKDLASAGTDNYSSSENRAFRACSANTYCAEFTEPKFNDRIARYGQSPSTQNNQSFITSDVGETDTFGLGARIIGRPFDFYGSKLPPAGVASHLQSLDAEGLCVPGKNPIATTTVEGLNTIPAGDRAADKSMGIGKTYPEYILQNSAYYAACPAVDDDGVFTHTAEDKLNDSLTSIAPGSHTVFASSQNMSTNALNLPALDELELFNDEDSTITRLGYNKASCLRAPGASCFSDLDCSPNSFISQKMRTLTNLDGILSKAEQSFWKEELVCANSQDRYLASSIYPNPVYELNEHRCCRETGKDFTFVSQRHMEGEIEVVEGDDPAGEILLPGLNQNIMSPKRYSRTHTVYDKLVNDRSNYPPLYAPGAERDDLLAYDDISQLLQYNTLNLNNSRMCCTGHWVRNFATGANGNGGGHKFTGQTQQRIDKTVLKPLNWEPQNDPPLNEFDDYTPIPYRCTPEDWQTTDCEIKNIAAGSDEEKRWLNWFGKLELLGIPQILVETNNNGLSDDQEFFAPLNENQEPSTGRPPLDKTVKDVGDNGIADASLGGKDYYSAASYENFEIGPDKLKKVFSEDSFSCCIPTGVEIPGGTPDNKCCTGQADVNDDGLNRCCLNDFADVSVYTNRYVSSEGASINGQPISDADVDPMTGYIRKEVVLEMAPSMCCSGAAAYGIAIGDYFIPMNDDGVIQNAKSRRWLYLEDLDAAEETGGGAVKFDAGLKWNNHVYCVPQELSQSGGSDGGGSGGSGATQN